MSKTVTIGGVPVGEGHPSFVIAEIGINHNGSLDIAKSLIQVAAEAGCQAVKFQKRSVEKVYSPQERAKPREIPDDVLANAIRRGMLPADRIRQLTESSFQNTTNGDQKYCLEFGEKEYREIDLFCREVGILWFASPWDLESVDFLDRLGVPCFKIASASLTDDIMLSYIRDKKKPVILSTGMSVMEEVEHAVQILGEENLILLHCVSAYPAEDHDLNLRVIQTLMREFPNIPVGYSGHERGLATTVAASVLGACMVERHITLDRAMYGSDQAASLEPEGVRRLVRDIRSVEASLGDGIKRIADVERPIREKLATTRH